MLSLAGSMQTQEINTSLQKESKVNLALDYYNSYDIRACCYCFMNLENWSWKETKLKSKLRKWIMESGSLLSLKDTHGLLPLTPDISFHISSVTSYCYCRDIYMIEKTM